MAEDKPGTRDWLKDLAAVSAHLKKTPKPSLAEIAETLNLHRPTVSILAILDPIFDPPTLKKVRKATLSYTSAKELTGLKGRVEDYPQTGRELVDQILAEGLSTSQIKNRVDQITGLQPKRQSTVDGRQSTENREPKATHTTHTSPGGATLGRRIGDAIDHFINSFAEEDAVHPVAKAPSHDTGQAQSRGSGQTNSQGLKAAFAFFWKAICWIPKQIGRLIKFMVGGFFNLIGKLLGKKARNIVQGVCFLLLCYGIFCAITHPGRVLDWGAGLVSRYISPWTHTDTHTVSAQPNPGPQHVVSAQVSEKAVSPAPAAPQTMPKASLPTANRELPTGGVSLPTANRRLSTNTPVLSNTVAATNPQAEADASFVQQFIHDLFSMNYHNVEDRRESLKTLVSQDFYKDFMEIYFKGDSVDKFHYLNLVEVFTPLAPVKLMKTDGTTEEFWVKGTQTIRMDSDNPKPQESVISILVDVIHDSAGQPLVTDIVDAAAK